MHRYSMSSADHDYLASDRRAMVGGAAAAAEYGHGGQAVPGEAHLYMASELHRSFDGLVAALPDPLGSVVVRVVPDDMWESVYSLGESELDGRRKLAPPAAVALDLMESGDPRHWVAAEELIGVRG